MPANNPARRGVAFTFSVRLPSQANTKINKVNPTLATGDVKVSKDGGGDTNMTTLPSVIGGGTEVIGTLSAAEMTADLVSVVFSDVAGAEWCDYHVLIFPEQAERGVLNKTTIATLASQVSFTLTAGSADNDAYNGCVIIVEDATTAAQKAVGVVLDYVGSTKTITLLTDPAVFTMAVGDIVTIMASRVSQQVLDVAAASHNTANSIGAKINAAGGAADPLENEVPGSYAAGTGGHALGRIGTGTIEATSPLSSDGETLTIVRGDDYLHADGRAITFNADAAVWPNLTGATIVLTATYEGGALNGTGTVVTGGVGAQSVRIELTSAETSVLPIGRPGARLRYDVQATLASSNNIVTLVRGVLIVLEDESSPP